jgi:hypothetical protein
LSFYVFLVVFSFTRLVHIITLPLGYLTRLEGRSNAIDPAGLPPQRREATGTLAVTVSVERHCRDGNR